MASREIVLSSLKAGINRLRIKGGASKDALFDGLNCWIDQSGSAQSRQGTTFVYTLPAGTKGLVQFGGKLLVLALATPAITNPLFTYKIIKHPDPAFAGTISTVHFAKPFLGWVYAAVQFSDGNIYHYWLQEPTAWASGFDYAVNANVSPSAENGFYYTASRDDPPPSWKAATAYQIGDIVQPSAYNGFVYNVVSTTGASPQSGATEPTWPTEDGAQVNEDANSTTTVVPVAPPAPAVSPVSTKYGNLTGFKNPKLLP